MQVSFDFKMKHLTQLILCAALVTAAQGSFADDVVDLGTVQNTAAADDSAAKAKDTAAYQAPTKGSLIATQPQSVISQHYIQENASAASNFSDIVNIAPSVFSVDPNGPGLMETQSLTMRGFQNGQYNVTFDGIPWGDSNDFTQHTTSYFMQQDIGNVVVDRGPGDASNIGNATFGGTIAVNSKDPMQEANTNLYASLGSFNTRLFGAQLDTGVLKNDGDASAFVDYKNLTSDGYLTNAGQRRENVFFKLSKPISDNTVLTFVTMQNKLHQNVALGTTAANIQKYGANFGLNNDPTSQDYAGYNYDDITSDFEYLDLKSQQGDLTVDNKLYTYAYYHNGFNGVDPGLGQANGTSYGANNVPGQMMTMNYRSVGDMLRMSEAMGAGKLDFGAWVDYQTNNRWQKEVDFSLGQAINPAGGGVNGVDRNMRDSLTTIQPYVQYEWKASEALTVTPGLKYVSFNRMMDATVNQGATGAPLNTSQTWTKALPTLTAHYMIQPEWSAYAQYAQGMLAPNINAFYPKGGTTATLPSQLAPEQSTNYQLGTTWASKRLTLSGDVYMVDFSNQNTGTPCGIYTCFNNTGGVKYNGVESEGTYVLGQGMSLYGNYAINNYSMSTAGGTLQNVPKNTATAGLIYNQGPAYASLIAKEVGQRYSGTDYSVNPNGNPISMGSYTIVNFASSYTFSKDDGLGKNTKVGFQINNLLNKNSIFASFANDASAAQNPMFYTIPTRSFMVSLSADM
ncbi:TonB-dependent receptor [Sideroxydans sp. CL21]|uniref:TonB-dependent receptor n=1 Tax=Sideroxydans sp. CL21 TaxID=2600596 RepID=UPI0024BC902C|nr:TonB-dependent receptor [Sideroxydans sp. CL21]